MFGMDRFLWECDCDDVRERNAETRNSLRSAFSFLSEDEIEKINAEVEAQCKWFRKASIPDVWTLKNTVYGPITR